jgi:hypothetical protein
VRRMNEVVKLMWVVRRASGTTGNWGNGELEFCTQRKARDRTVRNLHSEKSWNREKGTANLRACERGGSIERFAMYVISLLQSVKCLGDINDILRHNCRA